jgi:hypothetical protein
MKAYRKHLGVVLLTFPFLLGSCTAMQMYLKSRELPPLAREIVSNVRGEAGGDGGKSAAVPDIETLKAGMRERYREMKPYYLTDAVKENRNGYVYVADVRRESIDTRRMLAKTIGRENEARRQLYDKIAKHLGIAPEYAERIPKAFAEEWGKPVK